MMYGKLNPDRLCRVIEQILNERDETIEVKVTLIKKEDAKIWKPKEEETAS